MQKRRVNDHSVLFSKMCIRDRWFASMRWFAKVDSVVEWSAFMCSMCLCLKLRPVWHMWNLLQFEQFSFYTPGRSNLFCALGMRFEDVYKRQVMV